MSGMQHSSLPMAGPRTHRRAAMNSPKTRPPAVVSTGSSLWHSPQLGLPSVVAISRRAAGRALHAALHDGADIEDIDTSREQPQYQPASSPGNSSSMPSGPAGRTHINLEKLLAAWDKGVAERSMHMLTELQRGRGLQAKPRQRIIRHERPNPNSRRTQRGVNGLRPQTPRRTATNDGMHPTSSMSNDQPEIAGSRNATSEMALTLNQQQKQETAGRHEGTSQHSPTPDQQQQQQQQQQQRTSGRRRQQTKQPSASAAPSTSSDQYFYKQLDPKLPLYKDHQQHMRADLPDYMAGPPSPLPQQATRLPAISVTDVNQWLQGKPPPHLKGYTFDMVATQAPTLVVHAAMKICSKSGRAADIERLLEAMVRTQQATTYTWGTAFQALAEAGHLNLAHKHFDQACKAQHDIGPVGASVLIKLSAHNRNLEQALEMYYRMCSVRTTFNRYMFNALLHLCGVMGRVNDALDILIHMRAEATVNSACTPDAYTYSALLQAITAAQRWELLNSVFFALLEENIEPAAQLWSLLILGAGRAQSKTTHDKANWARNYWKAYRDKLGKAHKPDVDVVNAYLWALCRSNYLEEMLQAYEEMPQWGIQPDNYTFIAILTGQARAGASLAQVQATLQHMRTAKIRLNKWLGTALLNAYKRCPEVSYRVPGAVDMVLEAAADLLREMVARRIASNMTFSVFINIYIAAGRYDVVPHIIKDAAAAGCPLDQLCYHHIFMAAQEQGQSLLAERMLSERNMLRARKSAAKKLARQRLALRQARF